MNVLMVCLGNICRSPMAEGIWRKHINASCLKVTVDSAGTANNHVNEHPDLRAIEIAKKNGVDISGLKSRQFSVEDFDRFDQIFVMDGSNYQNVISLCRTNDDKSKVRLLLDLLPKQPIREVPDPWFGGMTDFEKVFNLLEDACKEWILHAKFLNNSLSK